MTHYNKSYLLHSEKWFYFSANKTITWSFWQETADTEWDSLGWRKAGVAMSTGGSIISYNPLK